MKPELLAHKTDQGRLKIFAAVLLLAATFAVYANAFNNEFTNWDDDSLVVNNAAIRSLSVENLKNIFTFRPGATYQPLRVLSYALDYRVAGLDHRWYHFHNTLLHGLAAVFLFYAMTMMVSRIQAGQQPMTSGTMTSGTTTSGAMWVAFLTALLFVVHPVNCEAVVWLSGRKYVLLSFFSFLALWLYVCATVAKTGKWWYLAGSVFSVVCAVLSSPFGIVMPLVFVLYDYARNRALNPLVCIKTHWPSYLFFIIPGTILLIMLWLALAGSAGGARIGHFDENPLFTLWTMLRVLYDYGRNLLVPLWLNNRYPDYIFHSFFHYKIMVVAGVAAAGIWMIFKQLGSGDKRLLFCVLWFLILWLPASNIIPISTKMADRYVYTAFVGPYLGAAWLLYAFFIKMRRWANPGIAIACMFLPIVYFAFFTVNRNRVWQNSGTLWADSIKKDPRNFAAYNNLGVHLQHVEKKPAKAIPYYQAAIRLDPAQTNPLENLAESFISLENYSKAMEYLEKWQDLAPDNTKVLSLKATVWNNQGNQHLEKGDLDTAEHYFIRAVDADPDNTSAVFNLGIVCFKKNRYDCAITHFETVRKSRPEDTVARFLMGAAWYHSNRPDQGRRLMEEAMRMAPDRKDFHEYYDQFIDR